MKTLIELGYEALENVKNDEYICYKKNTTRLDIKLENERVIIWDTRLDHLPVLSKEEVQALDFEFEMLKLVKEDAEETEK